MVQPEEIVRLLQPFLAASPGPPQYAASLYIDISAYINILLRWNARVALTAIRSEADIVTRHFGESIFLARYLFPATPNPSSPTEISLADLGSGAGFPGLPIQLCHPALPVTLIESNHKKVAFLREVIRAIGLSAQVETVRAAPASAPRFDVVTLRAVEHFSQALPTAFALTHPGGRIALLIGSDQISTTAVLLPRVTWGAPIPLPLSARRVLLIGTKTLGNPAG